MAALWRVYSRVLHSCAFLGSGKTKENAMIAGTQWTRHGCRGENSASTAPSAFSFACCLSPKDFGSGNTCFPKRLPAIQRSRFKVFRNLVPNLALPQSFHCVCH